MASFFHKRLITLKRDKHVRVTDIYYLFSIIAILLSIGTSAYFAAKYLIGKEAALVDIKLKNSENRIHDAFEKLKISFNNVCMQGLEIQFAHQTLNITEDALEQGHNMFKYWTATRELGEYINDSLDPTFKDIDTTGIDFIYLTTRILIYSGAHSKTIDIPETSDQINKWLNYHKKAAVEIEVNSAIQKKYYLACNDLMMALFLRYQSENPITEKSKDVISKLNEANYYCYLALDKIKNERQLDSLRLTLYSRIVTNFESMYIASDSIKYLDSIKGYLQRADNLEPEIDAKSSRQRIGARSNIAENCISRDKFNEADSLLKSTEVWYKARNNKSPAGELYVRDAIIGLEYFCKIRMMLDSLDKKETITPGFITSFINRNFDVDVRKPTSEYTRALVNLSYNFLLARAYEKSDRLILQDSSKVLYDQILKDIVYKRAEWLQGGGGAKPKIVLKVFIDYILSFYSASGKFSEVHD